MSERLDQEVVGSDPRRSVRAAVIVSDDLCVATIGDLAF